MYPESVAFAATFDAANSEAPEWSARTLRALDAALAQGAVGVKVWKDIGMQWRDRDGRAIMIDDDRFTPVFRELSAARRVVLGHQGEPRNAWLPLEQMTIRGDREYFAEHPQYHMYLHPEWPSYDAQIAARDRWLDRNPQLRFIGVHLASLEWDVDRVADFLRRYPAASVDLAARLVHLQRQSVTQRDKVRQFFIEYQDRILYGSDLASGPEQNDATFANEAHQTWLADWRYLTGDAVLRSDEFAGSFQGLGLPRQVVDKVYRDNARRLFPQAWRAPGVDRCRELRERPACTSANDEPVTARRPASEDSPATRSSRRCRYSTRGADRRLASRPAHPARGYACAGADSPRRHRRRRASGSVASSARSHLIASVSTTASSKARATSARVCSSSSRSRIATTTAVLSPLKLKSRPGRSVSGRGKRKASGSPVLGKRRELRSAGKPSPSSFAVLSNASPAASSRL